MLSLRYVLCLLCCWMMHYHLTAQLSIESLGDWHGEANWYSIPEAGYDFSGEFESAPDQFLLDIFLADDDSNKNFKYRVDIHQEDIDWHPNLTLFVRRTGNGSWRGRKCGDVRGEKGKRNQTRPSRARKKKKKKEKILARSLSPPLSRN